MRDVAVADRLNGVVGQKSLDVSVFYRSFAAYLDAGFGVEAALESCGRPLPAADLALTRNLIRKIRAGRSLYQAMKESGLARIDQALVQVGEQTGNLVETCKMLERRYEERFQIERTIYRALLKPSSILVASLLLRSLPELFGGTISIWRYLLTSLLPMSVLATGVFAALKLFRRSAREPKIEAKMTAFYLKIPWVGRYTRCSEQERILTCLEMTVRSGADFQAMLLASRELIFDPELLRAIDSIRLNIRAHGVAPAFAACLMFSPEQIETLKVGEATGRLDQAFGRLAQEVRSEISQMNLQLQIWLPKILYGIAAVYAISGII